MQPPPFPLATSSVENKAYIFFKKNTQEMSIKWEREKGLGLNLKKKNNLDKQHCCFLI